MLRGSIETIPTGADGLRAKIARIRQLVDDAVRDPNFRQMAVEQLRGVRPRDWRGEFKAVQRFVQRMRFTRDPYTPGGLEVFTHPKTMLLQVLGGNAFGDCDDHVLLATAMLEVIGHPTRYRVGGPRRGQYQHIWIDALEPDSRQWVPIEFIKPGVPVGWDPSRLFHHTESHLHNGGGMSGLGSLEVSRRGRGMVVRVEHNEPLPSDVLRQERAMDPDRVGVTAEEMVSAPSGLGWVGAAINAAATAATIYDGYETRRRTQGRRKRDDDYYRSQGLLPPKRAPLPQLNYAQYAGALAQSGYGLYSELSKPDPLKFDDAYFAAAERGAPREGPRMLQPSTINPYQYPGPAAFGPQPTAMMQGPLQRFDTTTKGFASAMQQAGPYSAANVDALVAQLRSMQMSYGLRGLGEDPTDPGAYVPLTKPLAMPEGWKAAIDAWTPQNQWDKAWWDTLKTKLAARATAEQADGYDQFTLGQAFDITQYPGGQDGWAKDWSNLSMLGGSVVEWWMYFFALTSHPRFLKGVHGGWLNKLKWTLNAIDKAAKLSWLKAENVRKAAWQEKKDAWNVFNKKRSAEERRKAAAEEAKRRADAARKAAEKERQRIEAQRSREEAARRAAEAAKRAQENLRNSRGRGGGGPKIGPPPPPMQGPPPPPKSNVLLWAGLAVGAVFMLKKK